MRFGAMANSARGGPPRPPPVRDRVKTSCFDFVPSNYFLRTEGKTPATC